MANEVSCKWCDKGDQPTVLDRDGVLSSVSGQPGLWAHAYEAAVVAWDEWWPCQRKAAEEHAEIERLREDNAMLVGRIERMLAAVAEAAELIDRTGGKQTTIREWMDAKLAEVERLQAIISKAITWYQSFGGFREGHEDLGHVATEEAEDSLIEALRAEEDRREAAEAAGGES